MNAIINKAGAVQAALSSLDRRLHELFGPPHEEITWTFPHGGGPDRLPTWSLPIEEGNYLVVGLRPEFRWGRAPLKRCPVLLAINTGKAEDGITSNVEVNIPKPMRRGVAGCFAIDDSRAIWLYHRGNRLTVKSNQKILKHEIHRHFEQNSMLAPADDDGVVGQFIPIVRLSCEGNEFKDSLVKFVRQVLKLKASWRPSLE